MPQTNEGILLVVGAIFFLIGLLGGGFEISAIKIPAMGNWPRILSSIVGTVLMAVAVGRLLFPPQLGGATASPPTAVVAASTSTDTSVPPTNSSTEVASTPILESPTDTSEPTTNTPTPTSTNTAQPTNTPEPPTFTPTPAPTNTPKPTNTPQPTPVPTATIDADPTVYDNFNNPAFDGSINSGRWEKAMPWGAGCSMQQQDGKVKFSSIGSSNSPLCILDASSALATEVGALEAIIYAEPGAIGNYNIGNIEFGSPLSSDKYWFAQCGIFQNPNEGWIAVGLNVDTSNSGEGENHMYEYKGITTGQWYKFRVELHPTTMEVYCYLNDTLIASHLPEEAAILKNSEIDRELIGFWSDNTQSTYYFDDVRLLPNTP